MPGESECSITASATNMLRYAGPQLNPNQKLLHQGSIFVDEEPWLYLYEAPERFAIDIYGIFRAKTFRPEFREQFDEMCRTYPAIRYLGKVTENELEGTRAGYSYVLAYWHPSDPTQHYACPRTSSLRQLQAALLGVTEPANARVHRALRLRNSPRRLDLRSVQRGIRIRHGDSRQRALCGAGRQLHLGVRKRAKLGLSIPQDSAYADTVARGAGVFTLRKSVVCVVGTPARKPSRWLRSFSV